MIDRFKDFIQRNELFSKEDHLLLAFSGGADSVALFHLLKESAFSFSVAHVNYSLRAEESEGDENFVRQLAEKYEIECFVKKIAPSHWKGDKNIQAEARSIRYSFFEELIKENAFDKLLTAHHKDDNIESILMNITRGTGLKGLMGIDKKQGSLIRPLLFAERNEIENFLKNHNYEWREDSSNVLNKYKRNRFRNKIIPLFKEENPSFTEAIERMIENLHPVAEIYNEAFEKFKKELVFIEKDQIKIKTSDSIMLERFLFEFIQQYGFNRDQSHAILLSLNDSGKVFYSPSHRLFTDRSSLILMENMPSSYNEVIIDETVREITSPIHLLFSTSGKREIGTSDATAQFDRSRIHFPLRLRPWKEGDKIQPLGMKGMKKISDVLIDKKISRADKSKVMVLLSEDEIIWIVGIMCSDRVKVTPSTKEVWRVDSLQGHANHI